MFLWVESHGSISVDIFMLALVAIDPVSYEIICVIMYNFSTQHPQMKIVFFLVIQYTRYQNQGSVCLTHDDFRSIRHVIMMCVL